MSQTFTTTQVIKPSITSGVNSKLWTAAVTVGAGGSLTIQYGDEGNWVNAVAPITVSGVHTFVQTSGMDIKLLIAGTVTVTLG